MKTYNNPRNNGTPSHRKFKGFNFYIQCNEKLKKSNRERLLKESEVHLNEVTSSLPQPIEELIRMGVVSELDSSLTDYELLEQWNHMYDEYGYLMSEFSEQWEKEKMGTIPPQKTPSIVQTLLDEIESLKNRLDKLEKNNNTSLLRSKSLSF
jgi:sulfatase maturation enzyme AslB (radical SAM superfamily)